MATPDLEAHVLTKLGSLSIDDSSAEAAALGVDHQVFIGVAKSLSADGFVTMEQLSRSSLELTAEGKGIVANGSPEYRAYTAVKQAGGDGCTVAALEESVGDKGAAKLGMGAAMREKWLQKKGDVVVCAKEVSSDETRDVLAGIAASGSASLVWDEKMLTRRKLVVKSTLKYYKVGRGPEYAPTRAKKVGDLTVEALRDGSWKTASFKDYNFKTLGERVGGGYLQPLLKVRAEFRRLLIGMGFEEMETSRWVESSFWNFDALFQPQSHPARDAHDTFFVKEPALTLDWPADYYERVRKMHVEGGDGSIGHRCPFDEGEARKNLLRTHTTAVSSQMLYKLAHQPGGVFKPAKYFSIDRVFRNETMDSTHLCEFHQVEGLVADYDLSLGDLKGVIHSFFEGIGITNLRFKPAFNPYTEPSMEIFGYHPDLKKWCELGNSGMFRPEMLKPMGLPDNVRVIAWGLSLERPTMIKYRISNIRDLFGHKADIARTRNAPICVFP